MPNFGIGGPSFGLRDAKVGVWNGDGTYGTLVDVPSVQMLGVNVQTTNAQLEGDDVITDVHAKAISGQVTLRFGSVSLAVLEILTGRDLSSSGTTPNRVNRMYFTGDNFDWFGLCGKSEATQGAGDAHFFIPKCKIMEGFEVKVEYGQYIVPELTAMCVPDDQYSINGVNEVQTGTITGTPTGGTYTVSFNGQTTGNITYNATGATLQTAVLALSTVGTGNLTITGGAGGPYVVTFAGDLANTNVPLLTADGALLTGGTAPALTFVETTPGTEAENVIFTIVEHETATAIFMPPA